VQVVTVKNHHTGHCGVQVATVKNHHNHTSILN
jgi:hypothetical protein